MTDTTYIIHESVAGNDPRLHPKMEQIGEFWHYNVIKFPSNDPDIVHSWLHGEEVTENVAKAYKFTSAHENEISVRKSTNVYEEIFDGSGDTEDLDETKVYYRLTPTDTNNTLEFFKTIMRIHIKNHADETSKYTSALRSMVDQVSTINQAQDLMYDYFDVGFPINARRVRKPKFNINWSDPT